MLRTANAFLELFEFAQPVGPQRGPDRSVFHEGLTRIGIAVTDLAVEYARPPAARIAFNSPSQDVPGLKVHHHLADVCAGKQLGESLWRRLQPMARLERQLQLTRFLPALEQRIERGLAGIEIG